MNVAIYNTCFLKPNGDPQVNVGGIETLISYLIPVIETLGWNIIVYQRGDKAFKQHYLTADVIGINFPKGTPVEKMLNEFRDLAACEYGGVDFIEIFGADHFSVKNNNPIRRTVIYEKDYGEVNCLDVSTLVEKTSDRTGKLY